MLTSKKLINMESILSAGLGNAKYTLTEKSLTFDISGIYKEYVDSISVADPTINITPEAYEKMTGLIDAIDKEIAWHGTVERSDRDFLITDILVYPQIVTGATVDSDDQEYAKWFTELDDDQFETLRMQGHSHVNMGVTPSSVDESYYKQLLEHVKDYYIIIIMNKRRELTMRLYDVENNLVYTYNSFTDSTAVEWAKEQIKEFVATKTYPIGYYNTKLDDPYGLKINKGKGKANKFSSKKEEEPTVVFEEVDYDKFDDMTDDEYYAAMRKGVLQ